MINLVSKPDPTSEGIDKSALLIRYVRNHSATIALGMRSVAVTRKDLLNFLNKKEFRSIQTNSPIGNFLGAKGMNLPFIDLPNATRKFILVAVEWTPKQHHRFKNLNASERIRFVELLQQSMFPE